MDLSQLIRRKRQTLLSFFLIFLVVGLLFIMTQDFKYGTKSKMLVIQEGSGRVDPFSVSRSVEYLSDLLTRVVYSNSFFNAVMESDFNIDKSYFGETSIRQMKIWKKTVSAKGSENSGIISVNVYHKDNYQADQIALAVNHVLMTKHQAYHGLGTSVKINIIDQPITSNYPLKPNLLLAFLFIVAGSLFFGLIYIYLFPEKSYDINLFTSSRKSKQVEMGGKKPERGLGKNKQDFSKQKLSTQEDNFSYDDLKKEGDIENLFD